MVDMRSRVLGTLVVASLLAGCALLPGDPSPTVTVTVTNERTVTVTPTPAPTPVPTPTARPTDQPRPGPVVTLGVGDEVEIPLGESNASIGYGYGIGHDHDATVVEAKVEGEPRNPSCAPGGCYSDQSLKLRGLRPGRTAFTVVFSRRSPQQEVRTAWVIFVSPDGSASAAPSAPPAQQVTLDEGRTLDLPMGSHNTSTGETWLAVAGYDISVVQVETVQKTTSASCAPGACQASITVRITALDSGSTTVTLHKGRPGGPVSEVRVLEVTVP